MEASSVSEAKFAVITDPHELAAIDAAMSMLNATLKARVEHRQRHPFRAWLERLGLVGSPIVRPAHLNGVSNAKR
jgi:hypothetical protein